MSWTRSCCFLRCRYRVVAGTSLEGDRNSAEDAREASVNDDKAGSKLRHVMLVADKDRRAHINIFKRSYNFTSTIN